MTAEARPPLDTIALLEELIQLGMNLAREVERQAMRPEEGEQKLDGPTALRAVERITRSIRLTVLLKERLEKAARDETAGKIRERKAVLINITGRIAEAECPEAALSIRMKLRERLEREDLYDVLNRPISEVLACICKTFDVSPDWLNLSEEAWAQAEIASGEVGWPLASLHLNPLIPAKAGTQIIRLDASG